MSSNLQISVAAFNKDGSGPMSLVININGTIISFVADIHRCIANGSGFSTDSGAHPSAVAVDNLINWFLDKAREVPITKEPVAEIQSANEDIPYPHIVRLRGLTQADVGAKLVFDNQRATEDKEKVQ